TVAVGTGVFCSLVLSLAGFYLASNSLRREINSRTGLIIAATPVTDFECISGKFLGNLAYLASIPLACMISAMLMFLVRGEGPLGPFVFVSTYLWLTGPVVVFCAAIAIAFESLPLLSQRFGDFLYFLVWGAILGSPVMAVEGNLDRRWASSLD